MVEEAAAAYGRIDALVSNAGVWRQGKVTDFTLEDWQAVMGVNVMGNLWLAKHVIPAMEKQGKGVIVITTSVAAFVGFPEHALYCASKGALEALIRPLATDHAGVVRVVGVCPGTIDTPMLAASAAGWTQPLEELYADVSKKIPVRRMGQPVDVAKAVAFLISDDAEYIDAISLVMDGGTLALPPW
jgi:NAD(P)-dependent dehydrogenase (short-subunit alcohol dehydrogenase family)